MIGGLDPSGCAGLALDVRVAHALGVHACPVATTLTAQTPWRWHGDYAASPAAVRAQIDAALASFRIGAVKIGMLGGAENTFAVAEAVREVGSELCVVLDPILATSSGGARVDDDGRAALLDALWPIAFVATPNRPEAEALAGMKITDEKSRDAVANRLLAAGAGNVVIKGGHDDGDESVDHWYDSATHRRLASPRRAGSPVRGTGCVFASALAAGLALGKSLADALVCAKDLVTRFVEDPLAAGPVGIGRVPIHAEA
ncbi:MAG: hydroxymethylpyrimidine/phosphomethylpyrimidine kinase [Deltaproteobacteria bacterium]|nr:hydroxymethylpyrimidine/phosphomethylpyrimidine kinase [Deltaproteobacteria bacterium]